MQYDQKDLSAYRILRSKEDLDTAKINLENALLYSVFGTDASKRKIPSQGKIGMRYENSMVKIAGDIIRDQKAEECPEQKQKWH